MDFPANTDLSVVAYFVAGWGFVGYARGGGSEAPPYAVKIQEP